MPCNIDKHGIHYDNNVSPPIYLLQVQVTLQWFKLSQFALYHTREKCLEFSLLRPNCATTNRGRHLKQVHYTPVVSDKTEVINIHNRKLHTGFLLVPKVVI